MKCTTSVFKGVCSAVAATALAFSLIPVSAISAFADGGEGEESAQEQTQQEGESSAEGSEDPATPTDPDAPAVDDDSITKASKVVPYLTFKYSNGSDEYTRGKRVAPKTICSAQISSKNNWIEGVSAKVVLNGQKLSQELSGTYTMGISYRVLTADGWSSWYKNGAMTLDGATKIQAVKFKLTGTVSQYYSVVYRAKTANADKLGWARDGEIAGTKLGCNLKGVDIVIKKKSAKVPTGNGYACISKGSAVVSGTVKNAGAESSANSGLILGSAKDSAKNAVTFSWKNSSESITGGISYKVYQKSKGWSATASDGSFAGATSSSYPTMALKVNLKGKLGKLYDVYYRVYLKNYGWLGWAKNGESAGNTYSEGFYLSAVELQLVYKDSTGPSSSKSALVNNDEKFQNMVFKQRMDNKAKKLSSPTSYLILCDRNACRVAVYYGSKGNWVRKKFFVCAVGAPGTPTPTGTFYVDGTEIVFSGEDNDYNCWYGTVFDYDRELMFHSVGYKVGSQKDSDIIFSSLGSWASHGCVRLNIKHAKWIYDNIGKQAQRTKVVIY